MPEPESELTPEPEPEPVASAPEAAPAPEPEPTPEPVAAAWQPGKAVLGVLGGVVVLLLAAVVLLGVLAVTTSGPSQADKDRKAALAASKVAAKLVLSYDYRHLAQDFAKGKAVTTGAFATEYQTTTTQVVADVAPRYKTVVVADVSEGGVVRSSGSTVTVLLFVNQTSNSTLSQAPKITQSRVQMELTRKGGRWLVSKVDAL
jgi:Mce-associated membrane protein